MKSDADAWLQNSLIAWKDDLQRRHRKLMALYAKLEGTHSPILQPLGKLIEVNKQLISIVSHATRATSL
jgi:hypothetical protein